MKSLKISLEESGIENAIIAADKGFCSRDNINLLRKEGLKFIMPLKSNNKLIDYSPLRKRDKKKWMDILNLTRDTSGIIGKRGIH